MIDVFLVAMLLLNFKMNSSFIVMRLEERTYFIVTAVLTRLVTIALIDGFAIKGKKTSLDSFLIEYLLYLHMG